MFYDNIKGGFSKWEASSHLVAANKGKTFGELKRTD